MSNAIKAKSWPTGFQLAYPMSDHPTIVWKTVVTLGFKKGDAVIQSGYRVTLAVSNSPLLYGVALADGAIAATVPIAVGCPNNVFIGQITAADISAAAIPLACDIEGGTGAMFINHDATTELVVNLIEAVAEDDDTDTTDGCRVYFQIVRSSFDNAVDEEA